MAMRSYPDPFSPFASGEKSASDQRDKVLRQAQQLEMSGDPQDAMLAANLRKQAEGINYSTSGYADPLGKAKSDFAQQSQNDFANFQEQAAFDETQGRGRELIGQSKGLYDAALNDPTDRYVMERLREMSDPSKTQAALFTQGADQAAAASGARWQQQQESLAMRGVTPQSGAYQAAQNQNLASRQQDVQRARLNSNLAGTQQASQALSQMGNQQQAQFGRKQQALDTYGNALKTPVGVAPKLTGSGNAQPTINQGTGATFKPVSYADFQSEWAKANAPKPKTSWF